MVAKREECEPSHGPALYGGIFDAKQLAKAGFVYIPTEGSNDLVECPFCQYQVEGWEADDDPW